MPNVHEGHRRRLKARFLREGLDHFEAHNVLELLLFYAVPQRDTNELAHALIAKFGTLTAVFEASFEDLCATSGVGENTATLLKLVPELSRRYFDEVDGSEVVFDNIESIGAFLMPKFIGRTEEHVYLLCLDSRGAVAYGDFISVGNVGAASVYARDVIEVVMRTKATSVVMAHNHPHGIAIPSRADLTTTQTIEQALAAVHVQLIDHFIFAGNDYVSLRDSGFFEFKRMGP